MINTDKITDYLANKQPTVCDTKPARGYEGQAKIKNKIVRTHVTERNSDEETVKELGI